MSELTIAGFNGTLTADGDNIKALGLNLTIEGYSVRIDGTRQVVEYGPGHDTLVDAPMTQGEYDALQR